MSESSQIHTLSRPLSRGEYFFWQLDQLMPMNFAVLAEGQGQLPAEFLPEVLAEQQRRHPTLRTTIVVDQDQAHFVPTGHPIPLQREAGDPASWHARLAEEVGVPLVRADTPLVRALLYQHASSWLLALVFHHAIADGRSGAELMRACLQQLAGRREATHHLAYPGLHDLYPGVWAQADAWSAQREQLRQIKKAELKARGYPQAIPTEGVGQRTPRLYQRVLPEPVLQGLRARARAEGSSLQGALGAAKLLAFRHELPGDEPLTLSMTTPADLRGNLALPIPTQTPGLYVTLLPTNHRVSPSTPFWALAQEFSGTLKTQLARGDGHFFYDFMPPATRYPPDERGLEQLAADLAQMPQSSMISNIGVVEPLPGLPDWQVVRISFMLCPARHQPLFTAVSSYGGQLIINFNADLGVMDEARVLRLMARTVAALEQAV